MQYTQAQIDRANAVNLEDFLRSQGETLIKSGREYRWKEHDSLTIRGNKWFRHSQSKGGYPVNFVGRFVPPAFGEAELTPEELEEIRKREERKDRLHQNYLKRKANGKQKEYEERTKAKKKAEIEARKQAIRTEDIARGVFIPVSSLPQLGPRKGA